MKLYREVKASERLPKGVGYFNISIDNCPLFDMVYLNVDRKFTDDDNRVAWLEPIEITEEEVEVLEELERRMEFMSEHMILGGLLSKLKGE